MNCSWFSDLISYVSISLSQSCSMGLKSGDKAGQGSLLMLFCIRKWRVTLAVCRRSLSCLNNICWLFWLYKWTRRSRWCAGNHRGLMLKYQQKNRGGYLGFLAGILDRQMVLDKPVLYIWQQSFVTILLLLSQSEL